MIITKLKYMFMEGGARSVTIKQNVLGSLIIKGVSILVSFLLVPLTIGYVSKELYGVWLTISSVMTWISFMDLGFAQGLKNKLAEAIAQNDWERGRSLVSTTYFMLVLIFVPLCLILEFLVPYVDWCKLLNVSQVYSNDIIKALYALTAFTCIQFIANAITSVVAAFQEVALSNTFSVIGNILALIAVFILTRTCPPSLTVLSIVMAAAPVLVLVLATIILFSGRYRSISPKISSISRYQIKDIFNLGYKFFISNIQVIIVYNATNVLISYVSSPVEVTSYNLAYRYLNVAMMLFGIIMGPLWPAYTDAYTKNDFEWMIKTRKTMNRVLLLSIIGCILLVIVSKPFYDIWIGTNAEVPLSMTIFVALYVIVFCWNQLNVTLLAGMGKMKLETISAVIGMLAHIPFALLLGQFLGAYGVVLSMIIINLIYAIIYNIQVEKILNKTAKGIWLE